ncbi:MAG TPA: hypothetical protein VED84_00165 [Acidimicrobiales bacterium]|nr:hypothetical protein [Acidimicrobiales bacterium]
MANIFGLVASEHIGALVALDDSGKVIFSAAPLVRAVVKHVSHALWVMDNEVDDRIRVARPALELLEAAPEQEDRSAAR